LTNLLTDLYSKKVGRKIKKYIRVNVVNLIHTRNT
jgi:hypothetical protein